LHALVNIAVGADRAGGEAVGEAGDEADEEDEYEAFDEVGVDEAGLGGVLQEAAGGDEAREDEGDEGKQRDGRPAEAAVFGGRERDEGLGLHVASIAAEARLDDALGDDRGDGGDEEDRGAEEK